MEIADRNYFLPELTEKAPEKCEIPPNVVGLLGFQMMNLRDVLTSPMRSTSELKCLC